MRRLFRWPTRAVLLIALFCFGYGLLEKQSSHADESASLVGTWSVTNAEMAGNSLPALKGSKLTFQADGTKTLQLAGGKTERGTYALVAGRPSGMNTSTDGQSVRPKGIYEFNGDRLKLVFAQNGGARPKRFRSDGASDHLLLVLRRDQSSNTSDSKMPAKSAGNRRSTSSNLTERCFRMGVTGFPHDNTTDAFLATQEFSKTNGDIIAHHIEGVPWEAMHLGKEFPKPFADEMNGKRSMTPPGGQVYLAISPGRGKLKPHDKAPKIPGGLRGKQYSDRAVQLAYLRYCRKMIELFDPDYLAIGIEVNEMYGVIFKREWRAYLDLHRYVYQELKKTHPELPIFASMTLHNLYNKQGGMVTAMADLMPYCDLIGVSYYPFFVADDDRLSALDWLLKNFNQYQKPYAMVETNDAAEKTSFDSYTVMGTEQKQLQYYQRLFERAQENDFVFIIAFIHRDYDRLWDKIKGSSPELFKAWMNCGFIDEEGEPRASYRLWKDHFNAEWNPS